MKLRTIAISSMISTLIGYAIGFKLNGVLCNMFDFTHIVLNWANLYAQYPVICVTAVSVMYIIHNFIYISHLRRYLC